MARIYISSTYSDLKDYRETVYRTLRQLRHDVIAMEDYVAADERPVEKCLKDVAGCDLYVGIFAFRYGFIPKDGNLKQLSITELEYQQAGDKGVARLIFLVKEGAAWPTTLVDAIVDPLAGERIATLRSHLKESHVDSFFESVEELARQVSIAVQQQLQLRPLERVNIDWEEPRRRLVDHMRRFGGARSEPDALKRYFPLTLQGTTAPTTVAGPPQFGSTELPRGSWADLVVYPCKVLLTGEAGSGKTTLLLYEAQRLAEQAAAGIASTPLPLYLSLKAFAGGTAETLIEMTASENGIDANTLRALWSKPLRPICLFLDGGDETAYRDQLIDAVIELAEVLKHVPASDIVPPPEVRSLVVACHPGPLQERMAKFDASWQEFLLLPLNKASTDAMLTRFDAASLIPFLDEKLRQTIRRPDLLSSFAQSSRERPVELLPRSVAEIYGLYLSHIFTALGGQYDYERVQRPVIAHIAYEMARTKQSAIACDDALYELIATDLETLDRQYHRRRRVMPPDWTAEDLHDHLVRSPIMDVAAGRGQMLTFSKPIYRDYFVAVYLERLGIASREARELIAGLTSAEQLQPLSFLLEMTPLAATLIDILPATALSAGVQIWLEDKGPNTPVPASICNAFRDRCVDLQATVVDLGEPVVPPTHPVGKIDANPRTHFNVVLWLASQCPLPALPLLEAAEDDHPLIRAVAQHALINAGDPYASLTFVAERGRFIWTSTGSGSARIGPLQLLSVPVPMMITLTVTIDELDIDPFEIDDAEFSFLPMSPSLFAANLFATTDVDWLNLLARFHEIAVTSERIAYLAGSRPRLANLAGELQRRAASYAGAGALLAADLGLPWDTALHATADLDSASATLCYRELKQLFSRANQGRTLRLRHLAGDPAVDVRSSLNTIAGGAKSVGLQIDSIEQDAVDEPDEGTPQLAVINGSQAVKSVEGGTLHSITVGRVRGYSQELPLRIYINHSLSVGAVVDGEVGAILIDTLESGACPFRLNATISIRRFTGSRFVGISVGGGRRGSPVGRWA